jgi:hypothetical protein
MNFDMNTTGATQTITQSGLVTGLPAMCKGVILYATGGSNATFGKDSANAKTPVPNVAMTFHCIPLYIAITSGTVYATPIS